MFPIGRWPVKNSLQRGCHTHAFNASMCWECMHSKCLWKKIFNSEPITGRQEEGVRYLRMREGWGEEEGVETGQCRIEKENREIEKVKGKGSERNANDWLINRSITHLCTVGTIPLTGTYGPCQWTSIVINIHICYSCFHTSHTGDTVKPPKLNMHTVVHISSHGLYIETYSFFVFL